MRWLVLAAAYDLVDPVFTPYFPNGTVDLSKVAPYAKLCVKSGVDVVLLGGSTAEWPSLSHDERLGLLREWRAQLDKLQLGPKRPTLLFHSGDVSVQQAKALTREAQAAGADQILVVAPCIMRPPDLDGLVATIKDIAAESPLPVMYYHYPELYGVDFPMDQFLLKARDEIPTLLGVKYIDPDMKTLTAAAGVTKHGGAPFTLYNNDPLLAGMAVGSQGAISYTTIFPLVREMHTAFAAGNAKAGALQRTVLELDAIIGQFGGKAAARALPSFADAALDLGAPRPPLAALSPGGRAQLKAALQKQGFLPKAELV